MSKAAHEYLNQEPPHEMSAVEVVMAGINVLREEHLNPHTGWERRREVWKLIDQQLDLLNLIDKTKV